MKPTRALLAAAITALAARLDSESGGDGLSVFTVGHSFVPSLNLTPGDLTINAFSGSNSIELNNAATIWGYDPGTNEYLVSLGGIDVGMAFKTGGTDVFQIYGIALMDPAKTILYGTLKLPDPSLFNGPSQVMLCPPVSFRIPDDAWK